MDLALEILFVRDAAMNLGRHGPGGASTRAIARSIVVRLATSSLQVKVQSLTVRGHSSRPPCPVAVQARKAADTLTLLSSMTPESRHLKVQRGRIAHFPPGGA